jgi:hypothetical protein
MLAKYDKGYSGTYIGERGQPRETDVPIGASNWLLYSVIDVIFQGLVTFAGVN